MRWELDELKWRYSEKIEEINNVRRERDDAKTSLVDANIENSKSLEFESHKWWEVEWEAESLKMKLVLKDEDIKWEIKWNEEL